MLKRILTILTLSMVLVGGYSCKKPETEKVTPTEKKDDTGKTDKDKEDKKEEETTSTETKITLVGTTAHSITFSELESYSYRLVMSGDDPYIYSDNLPKDLTSEQVMLEFEYKDEQALDGALQIFYAVNGSASEANSKKYGSLPASSTYTKYAVNISEFRSTGWGRSSDKLRIDPGQTGSSVLFIKNIVIRPMTDDEKSAYEEEQQKEKNKEQMAKNLESYLEKSYPSSVTNVTVTEDKVTITGSCGSDGDYILADITPWQDVTELETFPYTDKITDKSFSITLDRYVENREGINYDRVFSKWAIVKVDGDTQTLDSHARYADDVAAKTSPEPTPLRNKKGFGAGGINLYFEDCKTMDCGSITQNITLNSLVSGTGSDFTYGGKGYSLNTTYQADVDNRLGKARDLNLVVSAIILTPTNSAYKDPECTGGYYTMPNLTTAEAFNLYAAALERFASRYNSDEHGRIHHWIMHNEVDAASTWTNMGEQPMLRYLDRYIKSMRICYNIVRQYDQNASVLGSYTHCWASKYSNDGYAPKEMLDKTVAYSNAEGDFKWGVAYHPYPQDLTKPEFWKNDTQSTYSITTSKFVTVKNLEVIDKWIKLPENLYQGKTKRILFLSEQGTNSPSYSDNDLALQAAGAAWAWKKTNKLDGIDAFQWHNWSDNKAEFGLRIGLRTFEESPYANLTAKPAWYVWNAANTDQEDAVFDKYLEIIGISSWDEIFQDAW